MPAGARLREWGAKFLFSRHADAPIVPYSSPPCARERFAAPASPPEFLRGSSLAPPCAGLLARPKGRCAAWLEEKKNLAWREAAPPFSSAGPAAFPPIEGWPLGSAIYNSLYAEGEASTSCWEPCWTAIEVNRRRIEFLRTLFAGTPPTSADTPRKIEAPQGLKVFAGLPERNFWLPKTDLNRQPSD